jgi:uncharacterized membrane protein YbaN (DUF454 family)
VRLHVKLSALGMLTIAVGTSLYFGDLSRWLQVSLIALALIGATVILRLRTIRR